MAERQKEIYKVTLVGSAVNVILLLFKFVAGIVGHSAAMLADAVHSLSDFVTDVIVLVFVHISGKPTDKSHDYGHAKFETLAMTSIGIALLVVAFGILYGGVKKVAAWFNGEELAAPGMLWKRTHGITAATHCHQSAQPWASAVLYSWANAGRF